MTTVETELNQRLRQAAEKLYGADAVIRELYVQPATDERFGDLQCNAAMPLGKKLGKPPREVAEELIQACNWPESVARTGVAGPGFINITLSDEWLGEHCSLLITDPRLGVPGVGRGQTIVIDYSSPNVAKPMHIGHIRSTVIGNALDRIHRFLGYRVIADNHIGDWGTQFGLLILGYRYFVDSEALERNPVEELERVYVASYQRAKEDEQWMEAARRELVKLQLGDPENLALWEMFVSLSLREFERIYRRLNVQFDLVRGESYYRNDLPRIVAELKSRGIARESEGAQVVFLDEEGLPPCIVQKRDGAFNYATTDLATIESRIKEFAPQKILYVTDERQQLHFKQIFAIARRMGWEAELVHVWFGLMRLPHGTFSTREGNVVKLELLLDEAEARALEIVRQTSPSMPPEQQREVARAVGIGAVKYADLSQNPQSVVVFTWEKALSLEGNSAPYLQYTAARIQSVLDKCIERYGGLPTPEKVSIINPQERRVAVRLTHFADAVLRAAELYRPNILADLLYDLAKEYNTLYQNIPFLRAESGVRESRINLCRATQAVLRQGLDLLGIESPPRI